ncbi:MAG: TOBE domain-containing protein, partial [Candidatus Hodarchaeota archaeon]
GTPIEIWQNPHNSFVGAFIGEANLVECHVQELDESSTLLCLPGTEECFRSNQVKGLTLNEKAQVILRPQILEVSREKDTSQNQISGKVIESMFMGTVEYIKVELLNEITLTIHRKLLTGTPLERNEKIFIGIDPDQAFVYGGEFTAPIDY